MATPSWKREAARRPWRSCAASARIWSCWTSTCPASEGWRPVEKSATSPTCPLSCSPLGTPKEIRCASSTPAPTTMWSSLSAWRSCSPASAPHFGAPLRQNPHLPSSHQNFKLILNNGGRCEFCRRSEEHTSELQSQSNLVCRLLLEKKKK